MALISQNFKNDTVQASVSGLQPIVVLAERNEDGLRYDILDTFSTDIINITDNYGSYIKTKETIDKISSIKNSVDYEKKKLKTNTFRFSIRNYLDFATTLTNSEKYKIGDSGESPLNSFVCKFVILYFKTQTTDILNIDLYPTLEDSHCSIIFTGIVNRIKQNNTSISLQAEDFIHSHIADKAVPSVKVIDLDEQLQKTLKTDYDRVPMVYGSVDRSPLMKGKKGLYPDAKEIKGKFYTYKARGVTWRDYNLYVKGSDDWLGVGATEYSSVNDSITSGSSAPVIPEVETSGLDLDGESDARGYGIIKPVAVVSDSTGDNPIFNAAGESSDGFIGEGQGMILNNGYDFVWYRADDPENTPYYTGQAEDNVIEWNDILYSSSAHRHKDGRWIMFTYPDNVNMYRVLSSASLNHYSASYNAEFINDIGTELYFKPVSGVHWREIIRQGLTFKQLFYDEDVELTVDGHTTSYTFPSVGIGLQRRDAGGLGGFGSGYSTGNIRQVIYPAHEETNYSSINEYLDETFLVGGHAFSANVEKETNRLLVFEYFNDGSENSFTTTLSSLNAGLGVGENLPVTLNENQSTGVYKGATIKDVYIEHRETVTPDEIFGCVNGRTDFLSCENPQLTNDINEWQELGITTDNITLLYVINGIDETAPTNFDAILENLETFFSAKDEIVYTYGAPRNAFIIHGGIKPYQHLAESYNQVNWEDPNDPFYNPNNLDSLIFNSDDNSILRLPYTVGYIFQYCSMKMMYNVLEKEVKQFIDNKISLGEPVYVSSLLPQLNESGVVVFLPSGLQTYDPNTMSEEVVGYNQFLQTMMNIMLNVYSSDNEDSVLHGLIPEDSNHFVDIWRNNYGDHRKALYRRILKFVYVSDLNPDSVDDMFSGYLYDATDLISNDLTIHHEGITYFSYYLKQYLDDTMQTINSSIYDHLSTEEQERFELYVWDDNSYSSVSPNLTSDNANLEPAELIDLISNYGAQYPYQYQTDGFIVKPTDIIFDILVKEMKYGIDDYGNIDLSRFDIGSLEKSREVYSDWKMGFSILEEQDGKDTIEKLLAETMSFFTFTPEGKFTLVTIREKYTHSDIQHFIAEEDCVKYSFSRTKREKLVLQSRLNYRYDNGYNNYPIRTGVVKIEDLLTGYDGYNYYNLDETTGFKERNLRFHTDPNTVNNHYHPLYLLNSCNLHLTVKLELPLAYAKIQVSDIIHLPLLNNDRVFGIDYSKVQFLNTQPIYPAWIVTSVDIRLDKVIFEAYQLHYLGTDGQHGFEVPQEELVAHACTNQFNSTYPEIHNWNYTAPNPSYTYIQIPEIPYGDFNGDGYIAVHDLIALVGYVLGSYEVSADQYDRVANYNFVNNQITTGGEINVAKVVQILGIILE